MFFDQSRCSSHVCGGVRGRVSQEQTIAVVVGEAGVVAGAAATRLHSRHGRPHGARLLGLTQFLDEETFVTALLVDSEVKTEKVRLVTRPSWRDFCTEAKLSETMTTLMKKHAINLVREKSVQQQEM